MWEKEDFVLTMSVNEIILGKSGSHTMNLDNIDSFAYTSRELWDSYRDEHISEIGSSTYIIYNLDDLR